MTEKKLVKVSSRGTVSLGKIAFDQFYYAHVDEFDRIILEPVAVLPVTQVQRKADNEQR